MSVTKKSFWKALFIYLGLAVFCVVFTYVYEKFSYGESSLYMRLMFLAPAIGALISLLSIFGLTWIKHRFSLLLLNSSIAIVVSGCLVKGIIEVSGRTTTYEEPYWYAALAFLVLSILLSFFKSNQASFEPQVQRRASRKS